MPRSIVALLGLCLCCVQSSAATAAPPAGTVSGVAKDSLERPIPGAQMRLETADGRVVGRATADDQGQYAFTGVAPGTYAVVGEQEGFETATAIVTVPEGEGASADLTLASTKALDVNVVAKRLEEARIGIQPKIGASTYELTREAIESQPGGDNNTLNQVLLQAPGVTLDSSGSGYLHVRNEHANVQYRINGVALPEGVSLFGQAGGLSPRLAAKVDLITGALPAEYGLRTAGIVDVQTKSGAFERGGYASMYGGSFSWLQPSVEYGGSAGRFNYFLSADYLQNGIGLTPATPDNPIHDDTKQGHAFAYLEYLLDPTSKVSGVFGSFVGHFQIPNSLDQTPSFTVNGISDFSSAKANETQLEQNYYGVLSYLKATPGLTYQVSVYSRYTTLRFTPDPLADLMFNGIAQNYARSSVATGLQAEGSYVVNPQHTLRGGLIFSAEHTSVQTTSSVLPTADGDPVSDVPFDVFQSTGQQAYTYSLYLQHAWRVIPSVTINGGVRFDYLRAFRDEWQLSPRLNVVWTPTSTTTVHAGYARYFTPPPLIFTSAAQFSQFADTTAAAEIDKNATVRSERAHYFDAGITQQILPGLKVGLDAYYKQAQHLLDDGQFGAPVLQTPFNYKWGYNYGVELSGTYTRGGFSAYGNLAAATQWGKRIETAQSLFGADDLAYSYDHYIHTDHTQLITASVGAAYVWRDTRFSFDFLEGSGLRRSVVHPNDSTVPPYQVANIGISHRIKVPGVGKLEARFDVTNLWDEKYMIRDGSGLGVFAPQFGPRRGFFGGLKMEF
jgi:outer membrane receptor protein involved in Fe transport